MEDEDEDEIEQTLCMVREVFVFKLPPRPSAAGYKAGEWPEHIWAGRLRVVSRGDNCFINLTDNNTGELFAQCHVQQDGPLSVEPVLDSSRYFVLRIEDSGRHAYIGLGFRERGQAFDFNVALQDHEKHVKAHKQQKLRLEQPSTVPSVDYRLKEGEKIVVNLKAAKPKATKKPVPSAGAPTMGPGGILLPPPPGGSRQPRKAPQQAPPPPQAPQQAPPQDNFDLGLDPFAVSTTTSPHQQQQQQPPPLDPFKTENRSQARAMRDGHHFNELFQ